MFHFQHLSFNPHPIHNPSSFLPILFLPLIARFLSNVFYICCLHFNPPQSGFQPHHKRVAMLSNPRATLETFHSSQLGLYLLLKIFSSLGFYETLLHCLCPTCPPIHSPCSSLDDLKYKLCPCSNLPMAFKNPADLSSLRIVPLFNAHCLPVTPGLLPFPSPQGLGTFCSLYLKYSFLPNPNSSPTSILL